MDRPRHQQAAMTQGEARVRELRSEAPEIETMESNKILKVLGEDATPLCERKNGWTSTSVAFRAIIFVVCQVRHQYERAHEEGVLGAMPAVGGAQTSCVTHHKQGKTT